MNERYGDLSVTLDGNVAICEIHRPPHNFFDPDLIRSIADAFEDLDNELKCRAIVLCSEGKSFCAGANFHGPKEDSEPEEAPAKVDANPLYTQAVRVFACKKPVVCAIQGAAIGGGLGVALIGDFRVGCAESRFAANFVKLGIHPGFGLTHTLPRVIGEQRANLMFYTGRRINGETAHEYGLVDVYTTLDNVRAEAIALAAEIAEGAPLALLSTRATMRGEIAEAVRKQTDHEFAEQERLFKTVDHAEGVKSVTERRPSNFVGH